MFLFWFVVFKDVNTPSPFVEDFEALGDDGESAKAALPDHVYMDAMGFGMGCCCLQLTFQACNIQEARTLYDQLTPLCPIMVSYFYHRSPILLKIATSIIMILIIIFSLLLPHHLLFTEEK